MKILQTLLLSAALLVSVGCNTTLEQGGAYAPVGQAADLTFYRVDAAFKLAYGAVDAVFKFEAENREALWVISPDIKRTVDNIRPETQEVVTRYLAAREVYKANPVPANLSLLQALLVKMHQLEATALVALPEGTL